MSATAKRPRDVGVEADVAASARPPMRPRQREQAEADAKLLTLHLALQALSGARLSVERCDGGVIAGTLVSADEEMK